MDPNAKPAGQAGTYAGAPTPKAEGQGNVAAPTGPAVPTEPAEEAKPEAPADPKPE